MVRLSKKGRFVLPRDMRQALGIVEGDDLLVTLSGKQVLIERADNAARRTRGALKGTWGRSRAAVDRHLDKERRSWR